MDVIGVWVRPSHLNGYLIILLWDSAPCLGQMDSQIKNVANLNLGIFRNQLTYQALAHLELRKSVSSA